MGWRSRWIVLAVVAVAATSRNSKTAAQEAVASRSPSARYTQVQVVDGAVVDPALFLSNETCATCHERQAREFQGSLHSASHIDPLYRQFALLARREAGDAIYTFCAGCHAPAGVVSGLIPGTADAELPDEIKAGVTCDVCHQVTSLTGHAGAWKREGNASFLLQPGRVKFGSSGDVAENRLHTGEKRDFFARSEYCASCHTVIHPVNGLVIEGTYDEWKKSVYADKGIQCQDCHMQSVEDAVAVAKTLRPVTRLGPSANLGRERPIHPHYFVGGNADAGRLAQGPEHAKMATKRLQAAATLELEVPAQYAPGQDLRVAVTVRNETAGHNLPTGVTELRQMWVEVRLLDKQGTELFASGEIDDHGELAPDTIWFGAVGADPQGKPTFKPWEMKSFLRQRTVPPKGAERDVLMAKVPASTQGALTVEARLLYRSVAPHVVAAVMGEATYQPTITEMAKIKRVVGAAVEGQCSAPAPRD